MRAIGSASSSPASNITRRLSNQAQRIQRGMADGTLTAEEAKGLSAKQAQIGEAASRALADGSIDKKERKELRQMQRGASRDIFEQRHNASESPVTAEERAPRIEQHQKNMSGRIQKGISDGSLTSEEAKTLKDQQARIEEAKGNAMSDGTMDEAEYTQLRELQREASRAIFSARHNGGIRA